MHKFAPEKIVLSRVAVCLLAAGIWLSGGVFFVSQAQSKNSSNQTATKKATPKSTVKTTAKTTPKAAAKATSKPAPKVAATPPPLSQRFLTTAFDVNLREDPSVSASAVGQVKLGTVCRAIEKTPTKQRLGNKQDFWYRVETTGATSKRGWIFGGFLRQVDNAKRETTYREIAADRVKAAGKSFSNYVELYEFLTRIQPELKTQSIAAELSLTRLLALKNALANIPIEKQEQPLYKNFTAAQDENIVYSEPAGQWFVRSDLFWNLAKKYRNVPAISDRIAWEAAQNPLPGECEGYLNCYLFLLLTTHGEYLKQYPKGVKASESLKTIRDMLSPIASDASKKEVYTPPADVSDKAEFYKTIADLRIIISKTGFYEKDAVLRQLNQIAEGYK